MKSTYILLAIAIGSALFAYADPVPAPAFHLTPFPVADGVVAATPAPLVPVPVPVPYYGNPEAFQALGLKWIATATAIVAALSAFAAFVIGKIGEIKRQLQTQREELGGRLDRQRADITAQQKQITHIAVNTLPPGSAPLALPAPGTSEEGETARTGLLGLGLALLVSASLMGCSTVTPDPARNARNARINAAGSEALKEAEAVLGSFAVSTIFNAASQEFSGGKVDLGHAAASGVWANVNTADVLARAGRIANAYAGGSAPKTAKAINEAVGELPEELSPQAMSAVATVLSTAAGAPPAK